MHYDVLEMAQDLSGMEEFEEDSDEGCAAEKQMQYVVIDFTLCTDPSWWCSSEPEPLGAAVTLSSALLSSRREWRWSPRVGLRFSTDEQANEMLPADEWKLLSLSPLSRHGRPVVGRWLSFWKHVANSLGHLRSVGFVW